MELRLPKMAAVREPSSLIQSPRSKAVDEKKVSVDLKEKQPKHENRKCSDGLKDQQQNDEDDRTCVVEADEEEGSDSDDDAKSYTSNQTEDDEDSDGNSDEDDQQAADEPVESERQENDCDAIPETDVKAKEEKKEVQLPPVIRPVVSSLKPLSVTVAEPMKKVVQEPRPPRGSGVFVNGVSVSTTTTSMGKGESKKTRHKFQFPDADLLNLVLEDETMPSQPPSSRGSNSGVAQRRRFSSTAAVMATTLPLRRKSFSLTKSPIKNYAAATSPLSTASPAMSPSKSTRFQTRRKSTSACYSLRNFGAKSPTGSRSNLSSLPPLPRSASASPMATAAAAAAAAAVVLPPTSSSATSQMVLRVRGRKSDGIPELVISKRPARFLVWNWNDRQIRVPFKIQLGPHQHGIMLRQLRYVKSVMNDFPWAKTHLKELLAAYTTKDLSKEELYPQLNQLSNQVQQEIGSQVKKQKNLLVKKQRLTMQLSLATSVINEMHVTKYGRRGKPHETKLYYDPGQPTRLHWIRKNGDRSTESLDVDIIEIHCYDNDSKESELSAGIKKAVKKFTQTASLESCISLATPSRTLDIQLKSAMHREWLVNALCDVISFARQYRAAGARRDQQTQPSYTHLLRRM